MILFAFPYTEGCEAAKKGQPRVCPKKFTSREDRDAWRLGYDLTKQEKVCTCAVPLVRGEYICVNCGGKVKR